MTLLFTDPFYTSGASNLGPGSFLLLIVVILIIWSLISLIKYATSPQYRKEQRELKNKSHQYVEPIPDEPEEIDNTPDFIKQGLTKEEHEENQSYLSFLDFQHECERTNGQNIIDELKGTGLV